MFEKNVQDAARVGAATPCGNGTACEKMGREKTRRVKRGRGARLAALLAILSLILAPGLGLADGDESGSYDSGSYQSSSYPNSSYESAPEQAGSEKGDMAKEAGVGFGSALVSLVYGPTKILYATGGVLVGGLAFAFSGGDSEVAQVILTPSVRGDYVVTPAQLRGQEEIEFFGRKPEYRPETQHASIPAEADVAAAAPADGW
jgi:hypothetical protein